MSNTSIVSHIREKNFDAAGIMIAEELETILERKMCEMKKMIGAKKEHLTELPHELRMDRLKKDVLEEKDDDEEDVEDEANEKDNSEDGKKADINEAARVLIVKARIRNGKIQRRKKVSNIAGMTMRGGKLKRMTASERRKRKLGAKRAARKSRAKKSQMLRKRKLSLMKRQRLGI